MKLQLDYSSDCFDVPRELKVTFKDKDRFLQDVEKCLNFLSENNSRKSVLLDNQFIKYKHDFDCDFMDEVIVTKYKEVYLKIYNCDYPESKAVYIVEGI